MEVATVESKVITNNHKQRLEATYDGKQFCVVRDSNANFPNIPARRTIELDLKEAQNLALFILWR